MLNCIFYSLFFALFLNVSFGSLRLSQVNRTFLSSYKGMYEASVITVGTDGRPIYPYFNQTILKGYIDDYLVKNLNRYTTNYALNVDFYLDDGVTKCDESGYARNIKIGLNAKINFLFKYEKNQTISIKDKNTL